MDNIKEELIISSAILRTTGDEINKIFDKYLKENPENELLIKLKEEIQKNIDTKYNEFNTFIREEEYDDSKYQGEILKIYNQTSKIGITIKAEYLGNTLTSLEGFYLDFNNLEINQITDELEALYSSFKSGIEAEEKYHIYTYTNKDLCNMNYEEIKDNFIDKAKIKELENSSDIDEEEI